MHPIKKIAILGLLSTSALALSFHTIAKDDDTTSSAPHVPTLEETFKLETLGRVSLSPNGRYVAYIKQRLDFEGNSYLNQLWLRDTKTGSATQMTYGKKSVGTITWTPNGKWIVFSRDSKIHVMQHTGGEAKILDLKPKGVGSLKFSDDGKTLAFVANQDNKENMDTRKDHFGGYEVVREEGNYRHIFVANLNDDMTLDGKVEQITNGTDFSIFDYDLSPDGKKLVFSAATSSALSDLKTLDLYSVSVADKTVEPFVVSDDMEGNPVFSPDGKTVAFTASQGFAYNDVLYTAPASGGAKTAMPEKFDETMNIMDWTTSGLYFAASQKTARHIFNVNMKSGKISRVTGPDNLMAGSMSLSKDGKIQAYAASSNTEIFELFYKKGSRAKKLTDMSSQIKDYILGSRELIQWKAEDGATIEGVLIKPADFDSSKKYPLYVVTHGGPTGTDRPNIGGLGRWYPVDTWAGKGAMVLQTNYRGSAGYGEDFRRLNWRNLGVGPATDILSGIKHLIAKGNVDDKRIGCLGWSQGGHISAMLSTYSDQCTAAHMGAGISNWATYYYNTDITLFTVEYFGKTPSEDEDVYKKTSPMTYIHKAKTPVLIQHGENDFRVPIANAYEFRQGLIDNGVPVKFVKYLGMPHGPRNPKTLRAVQTHLSQWFDHYLFDAPMPDYIKPDTPEKKDKKDKKDNK